MFRWYRDWRHQRILNRSSISDDDWSRAFGRLPLLQRLDADDSQELRRLTILFLHEKRLHGMGSVRLGLDMQLVIALQACLPILRLGLDWYDGWVSVLVYPDEFAVEHEWMDEDGVMHRVRRPLSGEAWQDGPVILSWNDVHHAGHVDGENLVIHEFAHKLDMRNGVANGYPPLHSDMSPQAWSTVFSDAFAHFQSVASRQDPLPFDDYAAESPAEFFAVVSEVFFEQPARIERHYPAVYEQLRRFYRQDPLSRTVA
jgi:Mlc titration factor MtfA (ptsG expression regulator)